MSDPTWRWFNDRGMGASVADDEEMKGIRDRIKPNEVLLDTDRILIYVLRGFGVICAWVRMDVIDEEKEAE